MKTQTYLVTFNNSGANIFGIQRRIIATSRERAVGFIKSLLFGDISCKEIKQSEFQDVKMINLVGDYTKY